MLGIGLHAYGFMDAAFTYLSATCLPKWQSSDCAIPTAIGKASSHRLPGEQGVMERGGSAQSCKYELETEWSYLPLSTVKTLGLDGPTSTPLRHLPPERASNRLFQRIHDFHSVLYLAFDNGSGQRRLD